MHISYDQLKKAKVAHEKTPEDPEIRKKYGQAAAGALISGMPIVPEGKPYGEYQGWSNWDTWAFALWASNDYGAYTTIMDDIVNKGPKALEKWARRNKSHIAKAAGEDVDLDLVNWAEVLQDFKEE